MFKNLAIAFRPAAGLSACASRVPGYGYPGTVIRHSNTGMGTATSLLMTDPAITEQSARHGRKRDEARSIV